ncbi:unnamed protein product [Linum trigynum]|uniref:RING-type domain-containing protein n=1 Tax=Linum trigynum TaxID=586398 RepID=A0AAV2DM78_9ROSI
MGWPLWQSLYLMLPFLVAIAAAVYIIRYRIIHGAAAAGRVQDEGQLTVVVVSPAPEEDSKVVVPGTIVKYYRRDDDDDGKSQEGWNGCAICLEEWEEGDECRVLPECSHRYHRVCVDVWLLAVAGDGHCPICRSCVYRP